MLLREFAYQNEIYVVLNSSVCGNKIFYHILKEYSAVLLLLLFLMAKVYSSVAEFVYSCGVYDWR